MHPCGVRELFIDPLPEGAPREGALYPDGAHLTDLKEVRELLYKMQRPAIAPPVSKLPSPRPSIPKVQGTSAAHADLVPWQMVYPHDWRENDLVLFHNRGLLHSVVGAFKKDQVRAFHQCNLAASDEPAGPTPEDVRKYA